VLQVWNLVVYYKHYPLFEGATDSSYSNSTSFGAKSFVFQFATQNIKINKTYRTTIFLLFCMGVKLSLSHWGRNISWGCLTIGC
jgi:hypothetical protein